MRYDGQGKVVKEINSVCMRDGEQVRIDKEKLYTVLKKSSFC